jgi:hypothetical protein
VELTDLSNQCCLPADVSLTWLGEHALVEGAQRKYCSLPMHHFRTLWGLVFLVFGVCATRLCKVEELHLCFVKRDIAISYPWGDFLLVL